MWRLLRRTLAAILLGPLVVMLALLVSASGDGFHVPLERLANAGGVIILVVVLAYFALALSRRDLTAGEKRHLGGIAVFFVFSAVCWSARKYSSRIAPDWCSCQAARASSFAYC